MCVGNSGVNGVLGISPTSLSGESFPSDGENVLLRKFGFEDDVFVGSEKDKSRKKTRSERRKSRHEHARANRE